MLFALTQARRVSRPLAELAAQASAMVAGVGTTAPPHWEDRARCRSWRRAWADERVGTRPRAALREGEEKYRLLVENAGDAVFVAQDGRLSFVNRRSEELTGRDAETLRGVVWCDLVHRGDRERFLERRRDRLAGARSAPSRSPANLRRGGEERWVELNSVLLAWRVAQRR